MQVINKRSYDKQNNIVIMGAGVEAEKIYYSLHKCRNKVAFCLDNHKSGMFHGLHIRKPEDALEDLQRCVVLISSNKYYHEMGEQLRNLGLVEFKDYIKGRAYGKRIVYINANCYAQAYGKLLSSNSEFNEKYYVYYDTPLCDQESNIKSIVENCDICLSQDVRENNKYGETVSLEWHKKNIRKGCRLIVVPNLVGFGRAIFPQCVDNDEKNECEYDALPYGVFPFADAFVDGQVKIGKDVNAIIDTIVSGEPLNVQEIKSEYGRIFEEFKKREECWDIRIMDYVEKNIKTSKVMLDLRHPSSDVLKRIASEILLKLGCEDVEVPIDYTMDQYEIPVYPQVKRILGLKWDKRIKSSLLSLEDSLADINTYVRQYIYWCFERNQL